MKLLGNIIWFIFGGVEIALEYLVASLVLMITIIGIPFGLQSLKLGLLALWPFGKHVRRKPTSGCLNTVMNIIWFIVGGIWIALTHVFFGLLFYITIIGIPFGKQHMKLAHIALTPFGREIVDAS
ncbi:MAG: YccF domain-containing protein [Muribaculaceae bacterium]|nr:YccF domain-containing protein [Muribaculaceae bacterium]